MTIVSLLFKFEGSDEFENCVNGEIFYVWPNPSERFLPFPVCLSLINSHVQITVVIVLSQPIKTETDPFLTRKKQKQMDEAFIISSYGCLGMNELKC